jgi:DNA-binding protein HU-beta
MSMNKADFVAQLADKMGGSKAEAERVVNFYHEIITDELKQGGSVAFVGFGTYKAVDRKERKGRDPRTGSEITIPAARVPQFKAGKGLKDTVKAG